jgi:hypothetical protein
MSETLYATGINGQIEIHNNKIRITRKGVLNVPGKETKPQPGIPLSDIKSVQFKKAGMFTHGYIQFEFQGGPLAGEATLRAAKDENSVMFDSRQERNFEKVREEIEKQMPGTGPAAPSTFSTAAEIMKMADLREKGVITEAEFQSRKKKLMDNK